MKPATGLATRHGDSAGPAEFFIPDLCASVSVFFLVLVAQLLVLVHVLANSALPSFDWNLLGISSLAVQWVVLLSAWLLCQLRTYLSRLELATASAMSLLVVILVTGLTSWVAYRLLYAELPVDHLMWRLLRNIMVAGVLAAIVLRYFYLQHQLQRQQKLEVLARLESLRARIRPHFLFNTLNSIASLIASRPEAAEQAVEDLAELFRVSLVDSDRDTTVADEVRVCELYLGIEQLRLGDRLRVQWDVAPDVRDAPMPSLVLQPLVENAIYHGIAQLPEGGKVCIALQLNDNVVQVNVENPVSESAPPSSGNKLALANIRERLAALYGAQGCLEESPVSGLFRIRLSYPCEALES